MLKLVYLEVIILVFTDIATSSLKGMRLQFITGVAVFWDNFLKSGMSSNRKFFNEVGVTLTFLVYLARTHVDRHL